MGRVLCAARDNETLRVGKSATGWAEGELTPGATDLRDALDQIDVERPHVMVAFGPFDDLIAIVRERFQGLRIVTDHDAPGATVVATSLDEVRGVVLGLPRPGGPVSGG